MKLTCRLKNALAIVICVMTASGYAGAANPPGPCSEHTHPTCQATDNMCPDPTSGATTCTIALARTTDTATATPNTHSKTPNGLFCVAAGTPLLFATSGTGNTFQLVFSNLLPPAPGVMSPAKGTTQVPLSFAATSSGCFKYSIQVCDFDGGPCGYTDPKIIIGDTGIEGQSQKK